METPAVQAAYREDWEGARTPNDFVRNFKSDAPTWSCSIRVSLGW